jgi:Cft2 family RNA processing exonuclease
MLIKECLFKNGGEIIISVENSERLLEIILLINKIYKNENFNIEKYPVFFYHNYT